MPKKYAAALSPMRGIALNKGAVGMNYVDLVLLVVLGLAAWQGYRRGFLRTVAGLTSYVVAFLVAWRYSPALAGWLDTRWDLGGRIAERWPLPAGAPAGISLWPDLALPAATGAEAASFIVLGLAFLVLFVFLVIVVRWLAGLLTGTIRHTPLGALNRLAGLVAGLAIAVLLLGTGLSLYLVLAPGGQAGVAASVLGPPVMQGFALLTAQLATWLNGG